MTAPARTELLETLGLPGVARQAVRRALDLPALASPVDKGPHHCTFVTLRDKHGELRGCIGSTEVRYPVVEDCERHARLAAFLDPRFLPVERSEIDELSFEVSVLGHPVQLPVNSLFEAMARVQPHRDGVIVRSPLGSALFLPQVWEQLPRPEAFFEALWRKAYLPANHWDSMCQLLTFSVQKFEEAS